MQITMDDSRITSIAQLKEFLNGSQKVIVVLKQSPLEEKYRFIEKTIKQFSYKKLSKKDKRIVIRYLRKITEYKHTQLFRLITRSERGN